MPHLAPIPGPVSAREATQSVLGRIAALNPTLNALFACSITRGLLRDAADAAQARGDALGPLHGVPVTTKVNTSKGLSTDKA